MVKEIAYQQGHEREKDNQYRENYMKSFIHRSDFDSATLKKFKKSVQVMNTIKTKEKPKSKDVEKAEKVKHEQNKRAS